MFKVKELPFRSVEWLCVNRKDIDESPVYQRRGKIWPEKDKAFLIDSILNDYDVPKIYLADFTGIRSPLNKKGKRYAIIDGKQRLEAVTEFFESKLALNNDFQFAQNPALQLGGLRFRDLAKQHPELAKKFRNYRLVIMGVITNEEGKINDLFIRLNKSKPVVGAEIRNAMLGLVPPLIRRIAAHKFFKTRIAFQTTRLQDHNAAARILLLEFRGQFVDTKKAQLDGFVKVGITSPSITAEVSAKDLSSIARRCRQILNHMVQVFREKDPLLKSQGPLTVYYWFVRAHTRQKKLIRKFLVEFEALRRDNRKRASAIPRPADIDGELLTYDYLSRSPNDQASCVQRFAILESRFETFVKQHSG
jgi:Protein of unknown function DUF262